MHVQYYDHIIHMYTCICIHCIDDHYLCNVPLVCIKKKSELQCMCMYYVVIVLGKIEFDNWKIVNL